MKLPKFQVGHPVRIKLQNNQYNSGVVIGFLMANPHNRYRVKLANNYNHWFKENQIVTNFKCGKFQMIDGQPDWAKLAETENGV